MQHQREAGFLSTLTLAYINPLLQLGLKRPLELSDAGMIDDEEKVKNVYEKFAVAWKNELDKPEKQRSLWRALKETVGIKKQFMAICMSGIAAGCAFGPPLILRALSYHFVGLEPLSDSELWILIALLFFIPVLGVTLSAQSNVIFSHTGCMMRSALVPAIYRKSLILSSRARAKFSVGQIVNLFSNDVNNIQMFFQSFADPLFAPAQLIISLALIYREVGVSMFVGFALIVFILPVMIMLFAMFAKFRVEKCKIGDFRIKLTNEVLSGIRILKYYAWEHAFEEKIESIRDGEIKYLARMNYLIVFIFMFIVAVPFIMPIIIFFTYISLGNQLDAGTAFTTLALLGLVQNPISQIPNYAQKFFQARVSIHRIFDFLLGDELQMYVKNEGGPIDEGYDIVMKEASFSWNEDIADLNTDEKNKVELEIERGQTGNNTSTSTKNDKKYEAVPNNESSGDIELSKISLENPENTIDTSIDPNKHINRSVQTLTNISFSVKHGELVAVMGSVGSGKTSFLSALLGDLILKSGEVYLRGNIAYHCQQAWILNATVKENILFGQAYDEDRFNRAVSAACLSPDIAILPAGLETEIGEKGINLSGGQKARVSFARAVYRDADVYLLDDPLSAVDAHVGEHIFHQGIKTALKGKTVVLVTHQVHLLDSCDRIVILDNGAIRAQGSPEELKKLGIDLKNLVGLSDDNVSETESTLGASTPNPTAASRSRTSSMAKDEASPRMRSKSGSVEKDVSLQSSSKDYHTVTTNDDEPIIESSDGAAAQNSSADPDTDKKGNTNNNNDNTNYSGVLMSKEERIDGSVPLSVYFWYATSGSVLVFASSFIISGIGNGCYSYSSFWLADWGKQSIIDEMRGHPMSTAENIRYFNKFAWLSSMNIVSATLRTFILVIHGIRASKFLHQNLLRRVLNSPVAFFDTTPLGRILNRFSSDVTQSDEGLAYLLGFVIGIAFSLLGLIGNIAYTTKGSFVVLLVPLGYFYYRMQLLFRRSNTELKRLENISRSPIYTEFTQALVGATSLRAYQETQQFITRMESRVDENTTVWILQQIANWWLAIRLDTLGGAVSFFIAALAAGKPGFIPANYLTLSLQNALMMVGSLKYLVTVAAQAEAMMNSVERIKYYIENVVQEESETVKSNAVTPPEDWPSRGEIVAKDIKLRYRDGPLVLKGLTFAVNPKEKIGIAGRTGCGKSSLMVALFRIENLTDGQLIVDNVDLSTISLYNLRSKFGIIPQDAVMFSASVRFNLDPFNNYSDQEVWNVLESVNMKDAILSLPGKLDEMVSEGGENFSVGQRQLICIARVLLRKPKILVLDEATASVDNETDNFIQKMVRERFKDCTLLTIAHRLHTIIDSDRIMVLNKGMLEEFDKSDVLISKKDGLFAGLWQQHLQSHNEQEHK